MHRKERGVNILLYSLTCLLLISDGVAGWLYHRYWFYFNWKNHSFLTPGRRIIIANVI